MLVLIQHNLLCKYTTRYGLYQYGTKSLQWCEKVNLYICGIGGVPTRVSVPSRFAQMHPDIAENRPSGSTGSCTGFCTDCLHPGLTGVCWPFRGTFPEVIEA